MPKLRIVAKKYSDVHHYIVYKTGTKLILNYKAQLISGHEYVYENIRYKCIINI